MKMPPQSTLHQVPSEDDMSEFFGSVAIEEERDEEYWKYESKEDSEGVKVVFSFSVMESTVVARLYVKGKPSYRFHQGGATKIAIDYSLLPGVPCFLHCYFNDGAIESLLTISVEQSIHISWSYVGPLCAN